MSAIPVAIRPWTLPSRGRVGMLCLIVAEAAIFTIFVVAYIFYLGKSVSGPTPQQVLDIPIFNTICLLSSSLTIHFADRALDRGQMVPFQIFWFLTFALGAIFLAGTGMEWHRLIYTAGLTISTNLFGTTYYSLVGLHALHVTFGLLGLGLVMVLALASKLKQEHAGRVGVFSLYWHFVDAVWVVVFTVVYIIGR
ncbi:MAG: heme-copper oxidase subunit III [Bryobacteraceae bacterium]|jgi:cytochrome c oxidase subunit 3